MRTTSAGKRGLYLLPAFPAAALLCGESLAIWIGGKKAVPRALAWGAGGLGLVAAGGGILASVVNPSDSFEIPRAFALSLPIAVAIGALAWALLARHDAPAWSRFACAVATVGAIELASFLILYPALDADKSPRPIALAAAARTAPDEPVGLVGDRPKLAGLAYYGNRRIVHLDDADDIRRFLDDGGHTFVVRQRKLARLEEVTPVRIESKLREGRRAWLVVSPAGSDVAAPPPN